MAEKDIIDQAAHAANSGLTIGQVFGYAGSALGGIVSFVVAPLFKRVIDKHDAAIASIKGGIKDVDEKISHCVPMETWETNRKETRDNIIGLHGKVERAQDKLSGEIDSLRDHFDAKFDRLADLIRSKA